MNEIIWLRRGLYLVAAVALGVSALTGAHLFWAQPPQIRIPKIEIKIPEQTTTAVKHDLKWYAPVWMKPIRPKDEILPKPPVERPKPKPPIKPTPKPEPTETRPVASTPLDVKVRGVICRSDGDGVVFLEGKSGEQEWFHRGDFLCGEHIVYPNVQVLEIHKDYVLFKNGTEVERKDLERGDDGGTTIPASSTSTASRPAATRRPPPLPPPSPARRSSFRPAAQPTAPQSATAIMKLSRKIMLGAPPPTAGGKARSGILVRYVNPNEIFGRGKMKDSRLFPGDLILSINGEGVPNQPLKAYDVLAKQLEQSAGTLTMEIERKKQRFSVTINTSP